MAALSIVPCAILTLPVRSGISASVYFGFGGNVCWIKLLRAAKDMMKLEWADVILRERNKLIETDRDVSEVTVE